MQQVHICTKKLRHISGCISPFHNSRKNCEKGRVMCIFARPDPEASRLTPKLHAKIGQLALENDFLERALTKAGLLSAKP
jgi:hypothetical protein